MAMWFSIPAGRRRTVSDGQPSPKDQSRIISSGSPYISSRATARNRSANPRPLGFSPLPIPLSSPWAASVRASVTTASHRPQDVGPARDFNDHKHTEPRCSFSRRRENGAETCRALDPNVTAGLAIFQASRPTRSVPGREHRLPRSPCGRDPVGGGSQSIHIPRGRPETQVICEDAIAPQPFPRHSVPVWLDRIEAGTCPDPASSGWILQPPERPLLGRAQLRAVRRLQGVDAVGRGTTTRSGQCARRRLSAACSLYEWPSDQEEAARYGSLWRWPRVWRVILNDPIRW